MRFEIEIGCSLSTISRAKMTFESQRAEGRVHNPVRSCNNEESFPERTLLATLVFVFSSSTPRSRLTAVLHLIGKIASQRHISLLRAGTPCCHKSSHGIVEERG